MIDRYIRQTVLSRVGEEGQKKLAYAKVVVVGAGGLGSPILTYLVTAGVGRIKIIDSDIVSLSDLNRQFLYTEKDIERPKALAAMEALKALNGEIGIIGRSVYLTDENAATHLAGYDLILGAVDSFEARSVINRASIALNIPYIDGSVSGFTGLAMFSCPGITPCYNCVFPDKPKNVKATGVLGATAGTIGSMEANLALQWLLNGNNPIENRLLLYDGLKLSLSSINVKRDGNCPACGGGIK
jgi:adenylyltransferase/sulfurtransferase